jgi:hypothetical protein
MAMFQLLQRLAVTDASRLLGPNTLDPNTIDAWKQPLTKIAKTNRYN